MLPVQHERRKAVWAPLATQERAAHQALSEAKEERDHAPAPLESTADPLAKRGPGRPPQAPMRLEQAQPTLDAARREPPRLAHQRAQVQQSLEASGQASHFGALDRGVRRHGPLSASDLRAPSAMMRTMAQHDPLSQSSRDRIAKAERVVPQMPAPSAFVSG